MNICSDLQFIIMWYLEDTNKLHVLKKTIFPLNAYAKNMPINLFEDKLSFDLKFLKGVKTLRMSNLTDDYNKNKFKFLKNVQNIVLMSCNIQYRWLKYLKNLCSIRIIHSNISYNCLKYLLTFVNIIYVDWTTIRDHPGQNKTIYDMDKKKLIAYIDKTN